jgi:hypothetical protein
MNNPPGITHNIRGGGGNCALYKNRGLQDIRRKNRSVFNKEVFHIYIYIYEGDSLLRLLADAA